MAIAAQFSDEFTWWTVNEQDEKALELADEFFVKDTVPLWDRLNGAVTYK